MAGMERDVGTVSRELEASVLRWWSDAGVDALVAEEPRDWLSAPAPQPSAPAEARPAAPALPDQLDLFRSWLADSPEVPLAAPGAPRICPSGDPASGLMVLADMPGAADCESGTLLSGDAGRLFDRMLAAIGRDRQSIYLATLSCVAVPGGRLDADAAHACADLARHHIGLAAPKAVLLLGDMSAKAMLGQSVAQTRSSWREIDTPRGAFKAIATFSPSYLLKQPQAKAQAWLHLQMLTEGLNA